MIPVLIQEQISKLNDSSTHVEKRQFYYDTLLKIRDAINTALIDYERERKFRK